jgi:hypothetical protein
MSTSSRHPERAPIRASAVTGAWARGARRAIAVSTSGRAQRILWLAGATAATSLVAACASAAPSQPAAAPTATVTVTASAPSSAPASASQPPSSAPATAPSSAPPASGGAGLALCRTATLHIALDDRQAQGTAGSAYYPINFTNTSGSACEMYGYPGVSFAAAATGAGQQIGAAAQRDATFAKMAVRLAPGETAHAWLKVTVAANYPAATCQPVTTHWLRIYPPDETVPGYVGHTFNACASTNTALLSILPVRAGQGVAGVTP